MFRENEWTVIEGSCYAVGMILFIACVAYLIGIVSEALVIVIACLFATAEVLSLSYLYVEYLELKAMVQKED